jgi:hypothetical protein
MRRRFLACFSISIVFLGAGFLAPLRAEPISLVGRADAVVTKSYSAGGGGGNVSGTGNRLGRLLSEVAVPVLVALAGCLLVGTLASRNIGASLGIVVITLIGLIFLLSPQSIESLAKGVANTVF